MRRILFFFLLFFVTCVEAQLYTESAFPLPKELPPEYHDSYNEHYHNAFDSLFYNSELFLNPDSALEEYGYRKISSLKHTTYQLAIYPKKRLENNQIYYNWKEAETYISDILQLLMKQSSFRGTDDSVRVHIMKDAQWNAYAQDANQVYVTTGLLASIKSEAALAWVLAHELGHVYGRDVTTQSLQKDIAQKKSNPTPYKQFSFSQKRNNKKIALGAAERSRDAEARADHYGSQLLVSSGYDLASARHNMKQMNAQDSMALLRRKRSKESRRMASHPMSSERLAELEVLIESAPKGEAYIISEEVFNKLKEQSRYENLIHLRESGNFYQLCHLSFLYHLQFPDDNTFLYFLLEGMRLHMALSEKPLADVPFLMEVYNNLPKGMDQTIIGLFPLMEVDRRKLNQHSVFENDEMKYKTYTQMWEYAASAAEKNDITEAKLTLGLATIDSGDGSKSRSYLESYLSDPKAQNKLAAEIFLGEEVMEERVKYVSWNNVHRFSDVEVWDLYNNRERNGQQLSQLFYHHMKKYTEESQTLYLYDLHQAQFNDYVRLNQYLLNTASLCYDYWSHTPGFLGFFQPKQSKEFYSPLWFWTSFAPLVKEYGLYNVQIVKDRYTALDSDLTIRNYSKYTVSYYLSHITEEGKFHRASCDINAGNASYVSLERMLKSGSTYRQALSKTE